MLVSQKNKLNSNIVKDIIKKQFKPDLDKKWWQKKLNLTKKAWQKKLKQKKPDKKSLTKKAWQKKLKQKKLRFFCQAFFVRLFLFQIHFLFLSQAFFVRHLKQKQKFVFVSVSKSFTNLIFVCPNFLKDSISNKDLFIQYFSRFVSNKK